MPFITNAELQLPVPLDKSNGGSGDETGRLRGWLASCNTGIKVTSAKLTSSANQASQTCVVIRNQPPKRLI